MASTSLCIRCFKYGHHHKRCIAFQTISCSNCYRLNYLTRRCCDLPDMADHRYTQELRLSKPVHNIPRIYVDVKILGRVFAAVLNTFSRRTWVDFAIKVFISRRDPASIRNHVSPYPEPTIPIDIEYHLEHSIHAAGVCDMGEDEALIELGMDFLMDRGMTLNMGGTSVNTRQSWITEHPDQVEFVYNHTNGQNLRSDLRDTKYHMMANYKRLIINPEDFVSADSTLEMQRDADRFGDLN